MQTSLHRLLARGLAVALLSAAFPLAFAADASHADGRTRFTVHVDAQAAAIVRAWRAAHGLSGQDAGQIATAAGEGASPAAVFGRRCREAGGSVAPPDGQAPDATGSMCV
ncbi:MAG TPA: hypothetical protein VFR91_07070 [Dyella sp.]|nr:hypothetical protein [Dyella sp.]